MQKIIKYLEPLGEYQERIVWYSSHMRIGKHLWRIVGAEHWNFGYIQTYQFRTVKNTNGLKCSFWSDQSEWRGYDDHKSNMGLPLNLRKLWQREKENINAVKYALGCGDSYNPAKDFKTELTPEGEQFVIPGCEKQPEHGNGQGSLW